MRLSGFQNYANKGEHHACHAVRLIFLLLLGFLAAPFWVGAQVSTKIPRIGLLNPFSPAPRYATSDRLGDATVKAFHEGLEDLGYIEGKNILIEYRWAEGDLTRLGELAADLVRQRVDVIVTVSMKALRATRKATSTIPIVSGGAGDLVRGGLVDSLARPGGNLTGLTDMNPELNGLQLELLKQILPKLSQVGFLYDAFGDVRTKELHLQEAQTAAQKLGIRLQRKKVHLLKEVPVAFADMKKQGAEALATVLTGFTLHNRHQIVNDAAATRLPAMYQGKEFAEAGGLISYGTDRVDQWRRAAFYVDKILKGANPATLPVGQPRKLELVVNLKAAKLIGFTMPPFLLYRADKVIR